MENNKDKTWIQKQEEECLIDHIAGLNEMYDIVAFNIEQELNKNIKIEDWEIELRANLNKTIEDGYYQIKANQKFVFGTGKQGFIDYRVACEKSIRDFKLKEEEDGKLGT